jgi:nicotinamidase/pyrazinamidase
MEPSGGLYVTGSEKLAGNLERLVRFAGKKNIPLIASMDTHTPDDPEFEQWPPHCIRGTRGHDKIAATSVADVRWVGMSEESVILEPGVELLIEKHIYSMFDNPNTDGILRQIDADVYVVFGVATDYCVRGAALGLIERGLKTILVTDAVESVAEDTGREALEEMKKAGVRFVTTEEVLSTY